MYNRHHQLDVAHPLTAYLLLRYFHPATITNDTLITNTLVLSTGALIILHRAKYPLTEQTIPFRLIRTVVNGLGLQHLPITPFQDAVRRCKTDRDFGKSGSWPLFFFFIHIAILFFFPYYK